MLIAILPATLAISLFIYSIFLFKEKGYIPTTAYMLSKPEERKKMKTKTEYRFVGIIMLTLSIVFILTTIGIVASIEWIFKIIIVICVALAVYVIICSIREMIKR